MNTHYQVLTDTHLPSIEAEAERLVADGWLPHNLVIEKGEYHIPLWKPPESKRETNALTELTPAQWMWCIKGLIKLKEAYGRIAENYPVNTAHQWENDSAEIDALITRLRPVAGQ